MGRGGQPARHDVRRLPPADLAPRCRRSSTSTSEGSPGPGPGGYKGVGEGGAIAAPAAVANAIADALAPLGVTITRLPLSPATIVALIDEAPGRDGGER